MVTLIMVYSSCKLEKCLYIGQQTLNSKFKIKNEINTNMNKKKLIRKVYFLRNLKDITGGYC